MKLSTILLGSAATLALGGAAQAAPHFNGWYVGLEGGANWVQDWDFTSATIATPSHTHFDTASFDTGWAVLATVGYAFTNNWRLEFEAGYRDNNLDRVDVVTNPTNFTGTYSPDGSLQEVTLMANVLYDIQLGSRMSLSLGAGVGADHVDLEFNADPAADVSDWRFAYQGIAGLNYALTSRTDLFLNYRYLNVDAVDLAVGPFNGHAFTDADDFQKHTVTIGLRYDLTADSAPMVAAPTPPPAPEPAPVAKQFIVFFGFNKCNITSEADNVLSEAANSAKSLGSASILVVGHTDTVGSNKYNQKLSECRANAAKSNLESKGISAGSISASGRGETELMVQTGDGVKEPQNRRTTIDLN